MDNPTVLVVDDEQLIRWSLTERLSQEGYRLLEAGTAADALARHREGWTWCCSTIVCRTETASPC